MAATHVILGEAVGLWRFIKRTKDPNLYESLLEDWTSLFAITFALVGVGLNGYARFLWADGAASLVIGGLLVLDAFFIIRATRRLIAGETIALRFRLEIAKAPRTIPRSYQVADVATLRGAIQRPIVSLGIPTAHPAVETVSSVPTLLEYFETVKIFKERVPSQEHRVHS